MHSSTAQPVPPNVIKKRPDLGADRDRWCYILSLGALSAPSLPLHVRAHAHFLFLFGAIVLASLLIQETVFEYYQCYTYICVFTSGYLRRLSIMASPGQRRGVCRHMMAGFDQHQRCARCRDKKLGSDRCVEGKQCYICDHLTDQQRSMLSTPQYQIRKNKKSGLLVSPSKVTVVGVVDQDSV